MNNVPGLPDNFSEPPPNTNINLVDWKLVPLDVRWKVWMLWINFRTAADGTFNSQLQTILNRREMTQKAFAERLFLSEAVVSRWLKGRKVKIKENRHHIPANLSVVMKIVDELDCSYLEKHLLIRAYALEILWLKGFWND